MQGMQNTLVLQEKWRICRTSGPSMAFVCSASSILMGILPWWSPQTLTKDPSAKTLAQSSSRYGVCFSTVPRSIGLNSGTFRENSLLAGSLRQEGCQFRVASSHQPGAASSLWEAGGERNTSWHCALLESVSPVAALPVDWTVESETFPRLLMLCWVFCNRGSHQRLRLPSFPCPLTPALLSSTQPERRTFLSGGQELSVGPQVRLTGLLFVAHLAFFISDNPGLNVQIWNSPQWAKPFCIDH